MVAGRYTYLRYAILLPLLALHSRAQNFDIRIPIGSNNRSTAVIPDEVQSIRVEGASATINIVGIEPDLEIPYSCAMNICTINLMTLNTSTADLQLTITLLNMEDTNQTLILVIRESLDAVCATYNLPVPFTTPSMGPYVFTCEPVATSAVQRAVQRVRWRKFRNETALRDFLATGMGYESNLIDSSGGNFNLSGTLNNTLTVANSSDFEAVAYYYVPSFLLSGDDTELVTTETAIFVGPTIMGTEPEFSIEVVLKTARARSYSGIRCEATSFPPATVTWLLTSEDHPNGTNLLELSQFNLTSSGENFTLTRDAIVEMRNLQFEDDGNFTCIVENGQAVSTRYFRLRVKSNLRPLWPFIGIVGVVILVALSMLCHASVEKIVERKKTKGASGYRSPSSSSPNHTDSDGLTGSSVSSDSRGRKHGAVKRLSSNRPLIDESTL